MLNNFILTAHIQNGGRHQDGTPICSAFYASVQTFGPAAVLLLRAARLDAGLRPCNAAAGDGTPPFSLPT